MERTFALYLPNKGNDVYICDSSFRITSIDYYESMVAFLCVSEDQCKIVTYDSVSNHVMFDMTIDRDFAKGTCYLTTPTTAIVSIYGTDSLYVNLQVGICYPISSYIISKGYHFVYLWDLAELCLKRFDYQPHNKEWTPISLETQFPSTRNRILSTRFLFTKPRFQVSLLLANNGIRWIMNRLHRFEYMFYSYEGVLWTDPVHGYPITVRAKGAFLHYEIFEKELWLVFTKTIVKVCTETGVFQYVTPKRFTKIRHAKWDSNRSQWNIVYDSNRGTRLAICCVTQLGLGILRKFSIPQEFLGIHGDRIFIESGGKLRVYQFHNGDWKHSVHTLYPTSFKATTKELLRCWNRCEIFPRDIQYHILGHLSKVLY